MKRLIAAKSGVEMLRGLSDGKKNLIKERVKRYCNSWIINNKEKIEGMDAKSAFDVAVDSMTKEIIMEHFGEQFPKSFEKKLDSELTEILGFIKFSYSDIAFDLGVTIRQL